MKYKNILITGGAGFIGGSLAVSLKKKYPRLKIIALDNLKRRGSEFNLKRFKDGEIEFVHADVRNFEDLHLGEKIDLLIDCSAEPSVLSGYGESPRYIINTNFNGTINCLELARRDKSGVIFLSTSRIYPYDKINSLNILEQETRFVWQKDQKENIPGWSYNGIDVDFPLDGARSMYGATKLCSEIIFKEYISMYGVKGVINRCGVVAGAWQFGTVDQGVFTLWMLAHYFKKTLKYIGFGGKGKQVRDLLHIDDLCDLIDIQINSMDKISGETYNVGGGQKISLSLLETTELCEQISGNKIGVGAEPDNRPADVSIQIFDNKKVQRDLGWYPKRNAEQVLEDTYKWIKDNEDMVSSLG